MNNFYQRRKSKGHFRNNTNVKEQMEEKNFKKPTNNRWASNKSIKRTKTQRRHCLEKR